MSRIHLNRLYADLALLEFELEYLNNSLRKYYSTKYSNLSSVEKRRRVEYCRTSIPVVIQDIKDIKLYIQEERRSLYTKKYGFQNTLSNQISDDNTAYNDDDYYSEYDEEYDAYPEYNAYPEYDADEYD